MVASDALEGCPYCVILVCGGVRFLFTRMSCPTCDGGGNNGMPVQAMVIEGTGGDSKEKRRAYKGSLATTKWNMLGESGMTRPAWGAPL